MELMTTITNGLQKISEFFGKNKTYEPVFQEERRAAKRYYCWESTYFFETKEQYENARIIDISMGGLRFALDHDRCKNSCGYVLLMYDKLVFNIPVKIAWTKRTSGRYEYGAQFISISPKKQQLLKHYIQKICIN